MSDDAWGNEPNDAWGNEPNDDDFAMDTGELNVDDVTSGGNVDREGWYHLEVTSVTRKLDTLNDSKEAITPYVQFHMTVLETVDGQSKQGSVHNHKIYVRASGGGPPSEKSKVMALKFGLAVGAVVGRKLDGIDSIVDAVTGKKDITLETWDRAVGGQCVAKIVLEKSNNPKYSDKYKIPFGNAYSPSNPSVKDIPINKDLWALATNHSSQQPPPEDKGGATKPTPTPPPETPAVADIDPVDMSDLF